MCVSVHWCFPAAAAVLSGICSLASVLVDVVRGSWLVAGWNGMSETVTVLNEV